MKLHLALMAAVSLSAPAWAQDIPAPYGAPEHQWAAPPDSEAGKWGSSAGIERGPHGEIWAIDRCGANSCDGSDKNPIVLLDPATGKAIRAIGAGLFVFPHGLHVDAHGKVLLRIGTAGQRGLDETHFQSPSDVITAPNGDVFVTDGHAPIPNTVPAGLEMRVMKFDHNGKFIAQWGKLGSKAGEFNNPHALGLDNKGRLYVADRANSRIQIFTQGGKFITEWKQFGRPSGFYITGDRLYAIDADSTEAIHPGGWKKGIWIGSISKALPDAFVPDDVAGEGVVVAPNGNMYGAVNVVPRGITRYVKK